MRKASVALLSLLMVAALTVTASAASGTVSLTASANSVSRGDTFTVVAELSNTEEIKMGSVALEYDTTALEMVDGKCHVSTAAVKAVLPDLNVGTFLLMGEKKVSGKLFTFEFKVLDTAPVGQYTIAAEAAIGIGKGEPIDAGSIQVNVVYRPADLPAETIPETTPTQAVQPQTPDGVTVPQATQETTESTELSSPETTEPIQTDAPAQIDAPAQTDVPAREDAPKETKMRWTGPIAALILGVIGVGVKLFRKEKE